MSSARSGRRRLLTVLLAAALATSGCAAARPAARASLAGPARALAMLPLENLSGRAEYGDRFSRLVWSTMARTGRFDIADPGQVDAILVELRIRSAGSLTTDQVLKMAGRLKARWVVAGTLLECGTIRTPDGDIPTFGIALRVLDGRSGRVVWADMRSSTGQDHETIFGWGRVENLDQLAESTARDLIDHLQTPETSDSTSSTEGRP